MRSARITLLGAAGIWLGLTVSGAAHAQQFNSDSWISKPHGTATVIVTAGQRTTMMMTTLSLLPRWEFTVATYVYNQDQDRLTSDGYSTSAYAKLMFWQNEAKTGGGAIKAGVGMKPSYTLEGVAYRTGSQTFWTNAPITLPFFSDRLSWDLMPGASATLNYPRDGEVAWAFTYSSRLAWYPFSPKLALVGEIFGAAGQAVVTPDYRAGIRWEPDVHTNIALTYAGKFDGDQGSGLEIGIMLFSPPFFCIGTCQK
jgi:predicted outer membrane repeat protein